MKLQDIKIGTPGRLGLGGKLALEAGCGAFAWCQADRLGSQARQEYDHPVAGKGKHEDSGN